MTDDTHTLARRFMHLDRDAEVIESQSENHLKSPGGAESSRAFNEARRVRAEALDVARQLAAKVLEASS